MKYQFTNYSYKDISFPIYFDDLHPITPYSGFIIDNFPNVENSIVVDYGSGTGILSILSFFKKAKKIYAVDIDPSAIELAKKNSINNASINIEFVINDGNLKTTFQSNYIDHIVSNPASLPSNNGLPRYLNSGELGNNMIFEIIEFASHALKFKGKLLFIHTSLVPHKMTDEYLKKMGFVHKIIQIKKLKFRDFYLPLLDHFQHIKKNHPDVTFDVINGEYYEDLYLYEAIKI